MAKFKAGDTITCDGAYSTVKRATKDSYELLGGAVSRYMPITLVDKYWELASNEGEIED